MKPLLPLALVLLIGLGAAKATPKGPPPAKKPKVKLPDAIETRGRFVGVKMLRKDYDVKANRLTITYALANTADKPIDGFTARVCGVWKYLDDRGQWHDPEPAKDYLPLAWAVESKPLKVGEVVAVELVIQGPTDDAHDRIALKVFNDVLRDVRLHDVAVKFADGSERTVVDDDE